MGFLTTLAITSLLGFANFVYLAPLNSPRPLVRRRVEDGWVCHYDGVPTANIDLSIDLPTMLEGLCVKVNYAYAGCENFHSKPPKRAQPVVAVSTQLGHSPKKPDCVVSGNQMPPASCVESNASQPDSNSKVHGESVSEGEPSEHSKHTSKNKPEKESKPQHNDSNDQVDAQSFASPSDDEKSEHKKHATKTSKPKPIDHSHFPSKTNKKHNKTPSESNDHPSFQSSSNTSNPPSAMSAPDSNTSPSSSTVNHVNEGCGKNQHYSSQVHKCVDKKFFSRPKPSSSCENGEIDPLLHLCLDISVLGSDSILSKPTADSQEPNRPNSKLSEESTCSSDEKYSPLLSACVDIKFLGAPLTGNECKKGWKFDAVLEICLDVANCTKPNTNS